MGGELQNTSSKYRTNRLFKSRRFRTRNLMRSLRFINGFSTSVCAIYLYGTNRRYRHSMQTTSGLAWDYILKFIIIGDASVGKSSILVRFTEDKFLVDSDTTIGIEFGSHIVTLESGERLKLQIWDTAGSEQFRSVRSYKLILMKDYSFLLQRGCRMSFGVRRDGARYFRALAKLAR